MRIAIVGSGVSGLVAAHRLHPRHDITIFESDDRIGGHVHTWDIKTNRGPLSVDSGFIVYNNRNYPHFSQLLDELGVTTQPSTMSFSVRQERDGIEYNGSTLPQLFVQKRNLLRPGFLRMIAEILRFNRKAVGRVRGDETGLSLRELLDEGGYSKAFRDWYLLPMGSAIWSIRSEERV
jgi:predicted NAD/FAD-binding protein